MRTVVDLIRVALAGSGVSQILPVEAFLHNVVVKVADVHVCFINTRTQS